VNTSIGLSSDWILSSFFSKIELMVVISVDIKSEVESVCRMRLYSR
jgi:hypothetical protein